MAFKEFVKKGMRRSRLENDVVGCSNSYLRLSATLWNGALKQASHLKLYFDEEIPAIGFKVGEDGYAINFYKKTREGTPFVRWKCFTAAMKLSWEHPTIYKVKEVGGMFVVELKDGK